MSQGPYQTFSEGLDISIRSAARQGLTPETIAMLLHEKARMVEEAKPLVQACVDYEKSTRVA